MSAVDAHGVVSIEIGELGRFNVRTGFGTIRKIEKRFCSMGELQQRILDFRFGMVDAFEFLKLVLNETEQERELPPDLALQEELVKIGLTKATMLCMPVVYLSVDGMEALEHAKSIVEGGGGDEEGKAKAATH